MPPKELSREDTEQENTQNTDKTMQNPPQTSQPSQSRVLRPRAGQSIQYPDNGDSSIPASYRQQPFHKLNSKTYPKRRPGHGNTNANNNGSNSIHTTATSTWPSFLNSQWRAQSTKQTIPADTEDLTQAISQLTTQDNGKSTATNIEPTKSRWRTAKPKQAPSINATTNKTAKTTKAPPHEPNARTSQTRTTKTQLTKAAKPSGKMTGENPRQYLLPRPKPSASYLERAKLPPRRLPEAKKLLVILDLNGTLLLRSGRGSKYTPRPRVQEFLTYCLENHLLIVWSSARPHNVKAMVAQLFTPEQHDQLVRVWSRDHLRLGKHFEAKVQVYKQLTWLWEDPVVQASFPSVPFKVEDGWKEPPPAKWDQTNTVLLDDSVEKAASEPYNLIEVDELTRENLTDGDDVLGRVVAYLEDLKWEADVSAAMRETPFVNGQGGTWDWNKEERRPSA